MKNTTILILGAAAALGLYVYGKQNTQDTTTPSALSTPTIQNVGANYTPYLDPTATAAQKEFYSYGTVTAAKATSSAVLNANVNKKINVNSSNDYIKNLQSQVANSRANDPSFLRALNNAQEKGDAVQVATLKRQMGLK